MQNRGAESMSEDAILEYRLDSAKQEEGCLASRRRCVVASGYQVPLLGSVRAGVIVAHRADLDQLNICRLWMLVTYFDRDAVHERC